MKKIYFLIFLVLTLVTVNAQTYTHTYNPVSSVCIDGATNTLGMVTLTEAEVTGGCLLTDVDVIVYWSKTDGSCAAPTGAGNSYHRETRFTVNGPLSNQPLAISGSETTATWNGGVSITSVTTRFNSGPGISPIPSGTPVSGTFRPDPDGGGNLNDYNNTSALGAWSLTAGDAVGSDPLLIDSYQIELTTQADNAGPVISVPATINVNADAGTCTTVVDYSSQISATDDCGVASFILTAGLASGSTFALGTSTVTYTATDVYGNTSMASFSIVVTDNQAPVLTCPSSFSINTDAGDCDAFVTYTTPSITDNCPINQPTLQSGLASGNTFPVGPTTVSWRATQGASNFDCSFVVTVVDNQAPVISCPSSYLIGNDPGTCANVETFLGTATENCSATIATLTAISSGGSFPVGANLVTLRATDLAGLTDDCSFTITVTDTEDPEISCPANITVGNDPGDCSADVTWAAVVGADNCTGAVTIRTAGPASGTTFIAETTTTVTYQVTDLAGLTATCSFDVTVNDLEAPVITCPSNISVGVDAGFCSADVSYAAATFTDNCAGGSVAVTSGLASNSQFGVNSSPNTVEFTATDAGGNTSSCTFTITVADDEYPTITCPLDIVVDNDAGQCDAVVSWIPPTGADNCPGFSTTSTAGPAEGSTFAVLSTTTITYEVTDAASNTVDCSFTVAVEDNEFPVVTCPADQSITFLACQYTLPDYLALGLVTGVDNCTPLVEVQTPNAGTVITEETTVQVSITDPNLNETICAFTISPLDNTPPTFDACPTVPELESVNGSCQFFMPDYSTLAVSDVCNPTFTFTQSPAAGIPLTVSTSVTVTVSDGTNSVDCTFDVAPTDDTPPSIFCPADQLESVDASCQLTLADYTGSASLADNCDASIDVTQSPTGLVTGNTTVTLTATDDAGNTGTCTFEVEVEDTTNPTITCPVNQTESFNALCQFTVIDYASLGSITDNCDNNPSITQSPIAGTSIASTISVVFTGTDAAGNSSTCTFDVVPADNASPSIACPATQLVDANASCQISLADYTGSATTSDNCDTSPTVSQSPNVGTIVSGAGTTQTVTLTSTDASTNAVNCTFSVIIQDVTEPSITCDPDLDVNFSSSCQFTLGNYVSTPTVADNCDASPVVTQSPGLGTVITGSTVVTMTATDASGNANTCTFSINPDDNEIPSITCPTDISVDFDANCAFTLADYTGMGTASDNCDQSVAVTQSPAFGTVISTTTTVTLTATDDAANTNTCTFDVIPTDNTNPTVTCPVNQNETFSAGCTFVLPDYTTLVTTDDNCDNSLTIVQSPVTATSISGPQVVTITVTDDNANSTQCTFSVLPDDNTDPTVMCPANIPVSFNAQCQYNLGAYTSLGIASDNCDQNPTVTQNPVSGTLIGTTTTVTLTAMDANGNTGTCTLDVVPTDGTDPTITCPGDQNVSFTAGCDYDLLDYTSLASVDDNCDNAPTVAQSPVSTTTITTSTTVTLTVIDASSNVSSCTFDVIPTDDSAPVLSCPVDAPVAFDANCQYSLPDYTGLATISDNCDLSPALAQSPILGTLITGLTEITISATDVSGNISTCTFDIIPSDAVDPTIACPVAQTVSSNLSCQFAIIDYTSGATANDNCDQVVDITQSPGSGTIITVPTMVTLTATDDAVNTADCTFLVTPADNDNPSITCPGDQLEDFDADCEFDIIDYTGLASASDNCSATPAVTQDVSVSTIVVGTTTITLTATDTDLNTATCTFDVIPADNTAPIVTCPANQEETFGAQCQFILPSYLPSASTSDNCGLPTVGQSPVAGTVIGGNTVVTITSTDASGNIGTCTFAVSVSDVTNPTVICPADITEAFDASCTFDLLDYTNLASVTDNCDVAPFTVSQSPVATTTISGITTITLSVTDAESNTATCTLQVLPIDNENPSLICTADATVSFDANCMFILADYTGSVTADDNCDNSLDLVQSPIVASTLTLNTVVTITATDDAGNSTDCSFNVNPIDDVDPTLACPADYAVNANSSCEYTVPDLTSGATLSDNCDNNPFIVQSPTIGITATGATVVTLTATDDAGNVSTCNFTITVNDNEVPTLTCPSDQLEALTTICDFSVPDYSVLVSSTDNCDTDVTLVQSPAAGSIVSSNTTVTFTGTDDNLNGTTCSFLIVLEDQTNPSIVCPGDQTVTLGANCQFVNQDYTGLSTSSDNCDPSLSVTQSPLAGSLIGGSTVVTISAEDASGNVGTCTFSVLPNDTEAPTILACPNNIVQDNDPAICGSVVTYATVTAIDNCAGIVVPALMAGGASGSVFDEGTTTVTYVATDDNGNTAECEFDVTINDTEDPIVLCPADMNVNIDAGTCGALVTYAAPTVTDNCAAPTTPALDAGLASGAIFPIGPTVNTYSSMDASGNTSSCSFTVAVTDNENPTITCPGDVVVGSDLGNCYAIVAYNLPTVDDNCLGEVGPTLEVGGASGTVFVFGTATVTYSVVDAAANVNDCSFTVTVNDTEGPVLTCPNDTSINCDAVVAYDLPSATDNCAIGLVAVETSPAGGGFTLGTNLVEFAAADGNGNTGVCSFTVTVIDTVAPALTCPANQVASFDASCELSTSDYTSLATYTDNCDATPVITQSPTAGSTITGTSTITLTSEDVSGNTTSCTFDVIDSTSPTIACPASVVVVGSDINCQFTLLDYTTTTTSSDNCGGVALTQSPLAGTLINSLTTVTVTATDDFGNVNSCQFTVDLIDNINPSISCIGNQTVQFDASCMHELIDYSGSIGTSDNCDASVIVTQDPIATTLVAGVTTVTMTAIDDNFNSVTCSFTVSPIDNIAPTITCPVTQTVDFDANCEFALADYTGDGTTADNCSAVTVTQSPAIASIQIANTVVTLTAEDANGNMASCAFVVIPEDNIDPVIICPSDLAVDFDANCEYTLTDYTVMGTPADNCSSVLSVIQSPSSGQAVTGSTVITLTVNDGNGNSSTCTFNVNPTDNTPPSITCIVDQEVIFDENCQFEISDYNGTPSTSDNCSSSISVTQSPASGSFISGLTSITLTADDGNGNTATCSFMILPEDLTNPTIACPASFDVQFGSQGCSYLMSDLTSLVTADDNCASLVTITQNPVIGTVVTDTLSVTFTADDGNGNTALCSFDVNPSDDTEPTAICPVDFTVDFNENCEFEIPDYKPEVIPADNCGFTNITQTPAIGTIITEPTEIVITVDDGNGNSTECSFTVSPEDNLAPTLACPNNITESLDANCQFEMPDYTAMATAEDNCTDLMLIDQFPPSGTVILTTQVVTLSVVDNAGNDAECSFVLLPEDDTNPVIDACPDDQLASLDANCELLMPDFAGLITATDNCDISLDYQQLPLAESAVAGVGTYAITVGAIDASGNAALCEFDLIVTDESNPTVACPENQVIELNANCQFEVMDYTALAVGADACGSVTLTQSPLASSIITTQLNATIIVEDENGNTSSCTFFVDIVDMVATVAGTNATCQDGSNGTATVTAVGGNAPYTEDWGGFNPAALAAGTYAVTVTDVNGCSTTASVTIEDGALFEIEIDPPGDVVICEGDLVSLNAGSGYAAYDWSTGASVQTIMVSNEASYWVSVTNSDGCLSNTDTVYVSFYDDPIPTVISTTDGIISCSNDTASTYQWYLNGGIVNGATDSYYCPLGSGNYYVVITDANGCTVTTTISGYTYDEDSPCATGIDEHGLVLDVYPNPSTGLFSVKYSLESQKDMKLTVFDLLGQQVTDNVIISSQNGTSIIDLSNQANGIYTLRIELEGDKVLQQRLVLVK